MLAVVEQQVVVLFPQAPHGPAQGYTLRRCFDVVDHPQRLPLAELFQGAAQDFTPFQIVGDGSVAEVDAVVVEQAVLTRHLQVVSGSQDFRRSSVCLLYTSPSPRD